MKKKVKNRKNQIKLDYLVEIKSISNHDSINSIGIFPSGNFITVSNDKSIIIYDNNLLEIQTILNAHLNSIIYVSIKDDNNFITCSKDISIKIWIKTNNKFQIGQILNNIHSKWINQVIYSEDGNIISCSRDQTVKILKKTIHEKYQCIISLKHNQNIFNLFDINNKKILISSGYDGTYFWDKIEYKLLKKINVSCYTNYSLSQMDEDKLIISGNIGKINIISISNMNVIQTFDNNSWCYGILFVKNKNLILCGGNKEIKIYTYENNFENVQIIQNAHDDNINGLILYEKDKIISFSDDGKIKLWSLN